MRSTLSFHPPSIAPRPLGAKLQALAILDPQWVKSLEVLVDWKLGELKKAG